MIFDAHLGGARIAALVDGQLSAAEEERAWAHVHGCPVCREAVEREGWVKRQLACLAFGAPAPASPTLKGELCRAPLAPALAAPEFPVWSAHPDHRNRRYAGLAAIGASSVGAAMFTMVAFAASPAQAPVPDGRTTTAGIAQVVNNSSAPRPAPTPTVDSLGRVSASYQRMEE